VAEWQRPPFTTLAVYPVKLRNKIHLWIYLTGVQYFLCLSIFKIWKYETTLYIKTSKGYTPEGTGNKKKDIDSNHTIKRNLLLSCLDRIYRILRIFGNKNTMKKRHDRSAIIQSASLAFFPAESGIAISRFRPRPPRVAKHCGQVETEKAIDPINPVNPVQLPQFKFSRTHKFV